MTFISSRVEANLEIGQIMHLESSGPNGWMTISAVLVAGWGCGWPSQSESSKPILGQGVLISDTPSFAGPSKSSLEFMFTQNVFKRCDTDFLKNKSEIFALNFKMISGQRAK